jgi:hypothetical protein
VIATRIFCNFGLLFSFMISSAPAAHAQDLKSRQRAAEQKTDFELNQLLQTHQKLSDFPDVAEQVYTTKMHLDADLVPTLLEQAADDLEKVSATGREKVLRLLLQFPTYLVSESLHEVIALRPNGASEKEIFCRWLLNLSSVTQANPGQKLRRAYELNAHSLVRQDLELRGLALAYAGFTDEQLKAAAFLQVTEYTNFSRLSELNQQFGVKVGDLGFLDARLRASLLSIGYENIFIKSSTTEDWTKVNLGTQAEWQAMIIHTQRELDQTVIDFQKKAGWRGVDTYAINEELAGLFRLARLGFWEVPGHWIAEMVKDASPLQDALIYYFTESENLPNPLRLALLPKLTDQLVANDGNSAQYFQTAKFLRQAWLDHPELLGANGPAIDTILARALQSSILNLAAVGGMEDEVGAQITELYRFASLEGRVNALKNALIDWTKIQRSQGMPIEGKLTTELKKMINQSLDFKDLTQNCNVDLHRLN